MSSSSETSFLLSENLIRGRKNLHKILELRGFNCESDKAKFKVLSSEKPIYSNDLELPNSWQLRGLFDPEYAKSGHARSLLTSVFVHKDADLDATRRYGILVYYAPGKSSRDSTPLAEIRRFAKLLLKVEDSMKKGVPSRGCPSPAGRCSGESCSNLGCHGIVCRKAIFISAGAIISQAASEIGYFANGTHDDTVRMSAISEGTTLDPTVKTESTEKIKQPYHIQTFLDEELLYDPMSNFENSKYHVLSAKERQDFLTNNSLTEKMLIKMLNKLAITDPNIKRLGAPPDSVIKISRTLPVGGTLIDEEITYKLVYAPPPEKKKRVARPTGS